MTTFSAVAERTWFGISSLSSRDRPRSQWASWVRDEIGERIAELINLGAGREGKNRLVSTPILLVARKLSLWGYFRSIYWYVYPPAQSARALTIFTETRSREFHSRAPTIVSRARARTVYPLLTDLRSQSRTLTVRGNTTFAVGNLQHPPLIHPTAVSRPRNPEEVTRWRRHGSPRFRARSRS